MSTPGQGSFGRPGGPPEPGAARDEAAPADRENAAPADRADAAAVPTCFRHPGRETYVSCVRCGRPACPDCLRSAAVGQQCVECIRSGNRGGRRPSGAFGGRVVNGATVTWAIVAINLLLYLVEWAQPNIANDLAMLGRGVQTPGGPLVGVATGQWYRLITCAFLPPPGVGNLGPLDILFNMWALIWLGPAVERTLGGTRYLTVYLVSAVGGSVLYYYLAQPYQPALGASGAIFGLLGALFVVARKRQLDTRPLVTIVVLNLVLDFFLRSQIAWQAHVGGMLTGGILTAAFVYAPRRQRTAVQVAAAVVLLSLLAGAVVVRNHQLGY
jgi:membrane associated rhomboid family serine protease